MSSPVYVQPTPTPVPRATRVAGPAVHGHSATVRRVVSAPPAPPRSPFLHALSNAERRAILEAYPDRGVLRRLYRRLRLARGGYEEIEAELPGEGLIVDLGAGEGLLSQLVARRSPGRRVLAVDHDAARSAFLAASAGGLALESRCASLVDVPLPACAAILLVDVLHYFDAATQDEVLRRSTAALLPGGTLVLRDPDAAAGRRFGWNRLHERVFTGLGITQGEIGTYRSVHAWIAALERLGCREVRALPPPRVSLYADRVVVARRPG